VIFTLGAFFVCTTSSFGRTFTSPGSMKAGEYRFIENEDETYTEYYKGTTGEAIRGDTYSASEMEESNTLFSEVGIDEGTTGQTDAIVTGANSQNGFASKLLAENYLRTNEPYKTPGEAEVGDEFIDEGVAEGTLPDIATVAGASAGAVIATVVGGTLVGLDIGEHISELLNWPQLGLFSSGGTSGPYASEQKLIATWTGETMLGGVGSCTVKHYFHEENIELEPAPELCEFPLIEYKTHDEWKEGSETIGPFDECGWIGGGSEGEGAGQPFGFTITNCSYEISPFFNNGHAPEVCPKVKTSIQCREQVGEPIPEHDTENFVIWMPLFGVEYGAFPGSESLREHEQSKRGPEGSLTKQGAVLTPVKPLTLSPSGTPKRLQEVPAPARTYQDERAKKENGEPVVPPIEEGEPIPSPTAPEVPEITENEPWEQYKEAVEKEGLVPVEHINPEVAIDPDVGPNDVTGADPAPRTKVDSGSAVDVNVNPEDAPEPGEAHKPIGPPVLPGFEFPHFGVLCKGFPFGVPCWLASTIESWSATPEAPEWCICFSFKEHKIEGKVSLSKLESIMEVVRPAMVIFATIGLVLLFYRFAKGGGPPSGGGIPDDSPEMVGENMDEYKEYGGWL
jgi:hypothetical protein